MCRIALTEFRKNKKLAECDPRSVFAAVIQSAQLGLEVGLMGEASIVPYGKECQLIPGYTGLMKLARNTGKVKDIYAHEVRENDEFELTFGLERSLKHVPLKGKGGFPASDEERGPVVGHYAVAVLVDGSATFQAMSKQEIEKIRDQSNGYKSAKKYGSKSVWDEHPVEMGKKTVIRRLCKFLPKSPELAEAISLDTVTEIGGKQSLNVDDAINGTWSPDYTEAVIDIEASGLTGRGRGGVDAGIKQERHGHYFTPSLMALVILGTSSRANLSWSTMLPLTMMLISREGGADDCCDGCATVGCVNVPPPELKAPPADFPPAIPAIWPRPVAAISPMFRYPIASVH
jgi:recombination protein RecT